MRYLILTYLLSVAGITVPATDFYPQEDAVVHIKKTLKTKKVEITGSFILSSESDDQRMIVYHFKTESKPEIYHAVFTESMGRHELFDYVVITDNNAIIQQVKVIKYRSEHGAEIASKKWLSQFEDFSGGDLHYGDDISAISGATIAATSITNDIPYIIYRLKKHISTQK
ncbi:MAG: FMN-binding protein [Prolixibacteraceae bacterium]|nr:FMN-binding protein [Prolixibacteraceae bacterium]